MGTGFTDAGIVKINNIELDKQNTQGNELAYTYYDLYINSLPLVISVSGSPTFPATTFTDNGNFFPDFSNLAQFPSVISKSVGFSFTFNNLLNPTITQLLIGNKDISFTQNNVLTVSPADLSSVQTTTYTTLTLKCISTTNHLQTFNGKNYDFNYSTNFYKNEIKIVP